MKFYFPAILSICVLACGQPATQTENQTVITTDTVQQQSVDDDTLYESPEKNEFMEFSATKENVSVRLRDWWRDVDKGKLSNPVDTTMKVLSSGAESKIGASIHTFKYDDIQLEFYGPKDGNDIWLVKMEITGNEWSTARGIHVGDSVSDLKSLYPKAENQTSGDPNIYRYQLEDSIIEFAVAGEKISKINISYNLP